MKAVTRGWPPSRRKAQAERIRAQKPWLRSTGPRTIAGKQRMRLNALKHNMRSAAMLRLRRALQEQRLWIKSSVIARSIATKQSSDTSGLPRFARNDGYRGFTGTPLR
jgi:hypothetical protein